MSAVARLVFTNFTGTVLLRVITTAGLVAGIGGAALNLYLPPLTGGNGTPTRFALALETVIFLLPVAGLLCFVFGASLLPALFARLATSHSVYVLPYGRTKLLASAFTTVALTALFAAGIVTMYYYKTPLTPAATSTSPIRGRVKFPQLRQRDVGMVTRCRRVSQHERRLLSVASSCPRT
jgi:hypothetical protein